MRVGVMVGSDKERPRADRLAGLISDAVAAESAGFGPRRFCRPCAPSCDPTPLGDRRGGKSRTRWAMMLRGLSEVTNSARKSGASASQVSCTTAQRVKPHSASLDSVCRFSAGSSGLVENGCAASGMRSPGTVMA
jgi:hypothetical protein